MCVIVCINFLVSDVPIKFYGDPLIDFSLTHFLDRFAFKNPKKDNPDKEISLVKSFHNKHYVSHGSRGHSIKQLSSTNCTEDERFIFEYLNKKRERESAFGLNNEGNGIEDVDDDEFESYLDSLGSKKKGKLNDDDVDDDEEFDFLGDFNETTSRDKKSKRNMENADEENQDWDSNDDNESDNDEIENSKVSSKP